MPDTLEACAQKPSRGRPAWPNSMFASPKPENTHAHYITALEVSGEAVEAEFEKRLRGRLSAKDYRGDLERLIYQICREFKEEKKNCGQPPRPGSSTWNTHAPGLRANPRKNFVKDCMKTERYVLSGTFQH